jgi:hypothetical protein
LESLLRSILADFELSREPATNGTDLIHAELKEGRTNPRYRSALLEVDAQSHVLRRVVLHREYKGRVVASITATLLEARPIDEKLYTLDGHLSPGAAIYDRTTNRRQRGPLIVEFLRLVRVRPGGPLPGSTEP